MRGWLTVHKDLDRFRNTVPFDLPFSTLSSSPIAVLAPPCRLWVLYVVQRFFARGLRVCTSDSPPPKRKGFHVDEKDTIGPFIREEIRRILCKTRLKYDANCSCKWYKTSVRVLF